MRGIDLQIFENLNSNRSFKLMKKYKKIESKFIRKLVPTEFYHQYSKCHGVPHIS